VRERSLDEVIKEERRLIVSNDEEYMMIKRGAFGWRCIHSNILPERKTYKSDGIPTIAFYLLLRERRGNKIADIEEWLKVHLKSGYSIKDSNRKVLFYPDEKR
jgi:hypothetical protein